MSECLACEVARAGGTTTLPHTCPESGTWLAAEGHAEGFDEPAMLGAFTVSMSFRVRALDELKAREKLSGLVGVLLDDDLVEGVQFLINEDTTWQEPAGSSSTKVTV